MLGTRHEKHEFSAEGLPFSLQINISRNNINYSKESNWHENLEIQLCTDGGGAVLLNGEKHPFNKNDIVVVNSNVLHYTGTDTALTYSCLIVSTNLCKSVGLEPAFVSFEPFVQSSTLVGMFEALTKTYSAPESLSRVARLNKIVLEILIELADHYTVPKAAGNLNTKKLDIVKSAVSYIRENYNQRLTIDEIAKAVFYDKYALCREFKRLTGQTIFEALNNFRCIKARELLIGGYTVSQAALLCGFENHSFFAKTFKKYIGKLPSEYKSGRAKKESIAKK